jgi:hypothetical protein
MEGGNTYLLTLQNQSTSVCTVLGQFIRVFWIGQCEQISLDHIQFLLTVES